MDTRTRYGYTIYILVYLILLYTTALILNNNTEEVYPYTTNI